MTEKRGMRAIQALTYESIRDKSAVTSLCGICDEPKTHNSYLCAKHQTAWHNRNRGLHNDLHNTTTFVQWCNEQLPPDPLCAECEGLGNNNDYLCGECRNNRV